MHAYIHAPGSHGRAALRCMQAGARARACLFVRAPQLSRRHGPIGLSMNCMRGSDRPSPSSMCVPRSHHGIGPIPTAAAHRATELAAARIATIGLAAAGLAARRHVSFVYEIVLHFCGGRFVCVRVCLRLCNQWPSWSVCVGMCAVVCKIVCVRYAGAVHAAGAPSACVRAWVRACKRA